MKTQNKGKKIFVAGLGRSGFVAKGFGMRLVHLEFKAFILGEPTTPALTKGDLFIVISGGGSSLIKQIETAKKIGAKIIVVTSHSDSKGVKLSNVKFIIPGREKDENVEMSYDERQMWGIPIFLLGTAFEDFTMIVLDAILSRLAVILGKNEKDLEKMHSNLQEF